MFSSKLHYIDLFSIFIYKYMMWINLFRTCEGDAVALELNSSMIIEESRLPMLCEGSFVQGSCIVELGEGDSLRMVSDTSQGVNVCSFNNTVNAYLIVYQIN